MYSAPRCVRSIHDTVAGSGTRVASSSRTRGKSTAFRASFCADLSGVFLLSPRDDGSVREWQSVFRCPIGITWLRSHVTWYTSCLAVTKAFMVREHLHISTPFPKPRTRTWELVRAEDVSPYIANALPGLSCILCTRSRLSRLRPSETLFARSPFLLLLLLPRRRGRTTHGEKPVVVAADGVRRSFASFGYILVIFSFHRRAAWRGEG